MLLQANIGEDGPNVYFYTNNVIPPSVRSTGGSGGIGSFLASRTTKN